MGDGEVEFWILLRSLSYEGQVLNVEFFSHTKARRHEGGKMGGVKAGRRDASATGGPTELTWKIGGGEAILNFGRSLCRRWGRNFGSYSAR